MTKVSDLHEAWSQNAEYREAYEELESEFRLARSLIEARTAAGLTQERLTAPQIPGSR